MKRRVIAMLLAAASLAAGATELIPGQGVVKKIRSETGVINLAHEPIAALKWPAMVMDFKVKEAALLKGLEPGQKVSFTLEKAGDGRYQIVSITPAK